jgi:parallel beta-helix repeat protein
VPAPSVRSNWVHATSFAVVMAAALAWSSAAPQAVHVNCGDVITTTTTLDSDLIDCPGNGLVIGAPNITVNLNGHVIDGDAAGFDSGIDNFAGHDRVTIRNGTIREFGSGVVMAGSRNSRLQDLEVTANVGGVALIQDSDNNTVERCDITANSTGVFVQTGSDHNNLNLNRIEDNVQAGVSIDASAENRVQRNDVNRNGGGGILVTGVSDNNKIEKNDLKSNSGIAGIYVDGGTDNVVSKNDLEKNPDGIRVTVNAIGTLVERNQADKSTFDGIDNDNATTEITLNVTNKNGDLGIESEFGAVDGGGNRARGNGNPLQCTGVICS